MAPIYHRQFLDHWRSPQHGLGLGAGPYPRIVDVFPYTADKRAYHHLGFPSSVGKLLVVKSYDIMYDRIMAHKEGDNSESPILITGQPGIGTSFRYIF